MSNSISFASLRLGARRRSRWAAVAAFVLVAGCSIQMAVRPMPEAVLHSPELEAEAARAVHGTKDFLGLEIVNDSDQIMGARVVSDFHVTQNDVTGVPISRSVDIALIVKKTDGSCRWVKVAFTQRHMGGGSYAGLHGETLLEQAAMACPGASSTAVEAPAPAAGAVQPAPEAAQPPASSAASTDDGASSQAQIDTLVEGLGPNAAIECKAYVREVCRRQKGPQRAAMCKGYADSMRAIASSPKGSTVCKATLAGLPPASGAH